MRLRQTLGPGGRLAPRHGRIPDHRNLGDKETERELEQALNKISIVKYTSFDLSTIFNSFKCNKKLLN